MHEVEDFIYSYEGNQRAVMLYLHNLLLSYPHITCKISYKIPFYYRKSWLCYLNPTINGNVEFVFTRGNELSNIQGLLNTKGRTQVSGIEFKTDKEIPLESINEIIQEAILLDDTKPYKAKRNKK